MFNQPKEISVYTTDVEYPPNRKDVLLTFIANNYLAHDGDWSQEYSTSTYRSLVREGILERRPVKNPQRYESNFSYRIKNLSKAKSLLKVPEIEIVKLAKSYNFDSVSLYDPSVPSIQVNIGWFLDPSDNLPHVTNYTLTYGNEVMELLLKLYEKNPELTLKAIKKQIGHEWGHVYTQEKILHRTEYPMRYVIGPNRKSVTCYDITDPQANLIAITRDDDPLEAITAITWFNHHYLPNEIINSEENFKIMTGLLFPWLRVELRNKIVKEIFNK